MQYEPLDTFAQRTKPCSIVQKGDQPMSSVKQTAVIETVIEGDKPMNTNHMAWTSGRVVACLIVYLS